MKEFVLSFEQNTTQPWFTYFKIADQYNNYVKTNQ